MNKTQEILNLLEKGEKISVLAKKYTASEMKDAGCLCKYIALLYSTKELKEAGYSPSEYLMS